MRGIVLFFLLSGMLTACGDREIESNQSNPKKLQIITTIKPLQAIVTAIAGEYANSYQLIPDYASPHAYSFKPSDIRKVKQADVVFRIDEHMEVMLNTIFENLSKDTKLISLAKEKGIHLLDVSEKDNDKNQHKHGAIDFHIWASPRNALVMANTMVQTLIQLDPRNESHYKKNLTGFTQKLKTESAVISTALAKHQNKPYIVFHDSWQYFATEFQLQKPTVVSLHEGLSPGAKTLSNIRQKIAAENIDCIFISPSVTIAQIKPLIEKQKLKAIEIDVLARKLELNKDTYIHWLRNMGQQIGTCLED